MYKSGTKNIFALVEMTFEEMFSFKKFHYLFWFGFLNSSWNSIINPDLPSSWTADVLSTIPCSSPGISPLLFPPLPISP